MKHKSIIRAIEKQGWTCKQEEERKRYDDSTVVRDEWSRTNYFCETGRYIASWSAYDNGDVRNIHVRRTNDVSDSMRDYFAGDFFETIKSAVEYMEGAK